MTATLLLLTELCLASDLTPAPPAEETEEAAESEEEDSWSVDAPPGESVQVAIDTSEGTWISVDVSPDGEQLVFDLLGDLYLLPIEGGEAQALTSGVAWDMQPVWSPDGERIAFTSDRGGGDNLWVMEADGSGAEPVTTESFRLYNGPSWHPDGHALVGRKHFTSRRSLGAGEMWLHRLDGGSGLQLTQKQNDQLDVNEPVFSPDGRSLYYSQDATGGPTFQYNKDPNPGIYAIQRLDLESGETSTSRSTLTSTSSGATSTGRRRAGRIARSSLTRKGMARALPSKLTRWSPPCAQSTMLSPSGVQDMCG